MLGAPQRLLIVGLGNPGARYAMTRHNMGRLVVEALAKKHNLPWRPNKRHDGEMSVMPTDNGTLTLWLPATFMNNSGVSVASFMRYHGFAATQLLVVIDDTALSWGALRLRREGSCGGHNGLRSVEQCLGTRQYGRLRLGIGAKPDGEVLSDYVLGEFTAEERHKLPALLQNGVSALELVGRLGIDAAMNQVNAKEWQL